LAKFEAMTDLLLVMKYVCRNCCLWKLWN